MYNTTKVKNGKKLRLNAEAKTLPTKKEYGNYIRIGRSDTAHLCAFYSGVIIMREENEYVRGYLAYWLDTYTNFIGYFAVTPWE